MRRMHRFLPFLLACGALLAQADDAPSAQKEYLPRSGAGHAVIVISGKSGPSKYTALARDIADAGYYVVLVDGNDFWRGDAAGKALLAAVIGHAQASAHAVAGKVGVIGLSLGGASAITYAARMPEQVATVVAMYPLTNFVQNPADFVGKIKVPVLVMAGTADTYQHCCTIATARALADAAKANPDVAPLFALHEYPGAGHGFNMNSARDHALVWDSRDRAIAQLRQYLPDH